jgi:hypothetical protein
MVCDGKGDIEIEYAIAGQAGTYTLMLRQGDLTIKHEQQFAVGEDIKFTGVTLNESFCYEAQVYSPDGKAFLFIDEIMEYDQFTFCTNPITNG